jgi:hypothetical protein
MAEGARAFEVTDCDLKDGGGSRGAGSARGGRQGCTAHRAVARGWCGTAGGGAGRYGGQGRQEKSHGSGVGSELISRLGGKPLAW